LQWKNRVLDVACVVVAILCCDLLSVYMRPSSRDYLFAVMLLHLDLDLVGLSFGAVDISFTAQVSLAAQFLCPR
jgi:uncharacterized membrane protein YqhA